MTKKSKKMEFIDFARLYSIETLGLDKDHSFEKRSMCVRANYFVVWAPKKELKLDYRRSEFKPLAYLIKYSKSLRNYANVRKAEAHGGPDCPITPSLLESTPSRIALVVPHEKWHRFVDEYSSSEGLMIEESCGDAIGSNEAINIVKNFYGKDSEEYEEAIDEIEYYRKRAKTSKMLVEELKELYETKDFDKKDVKEILSKYSKIFEETTDCEGWNSVVKALDDYSYDALYPLAEDIYLKHEYEEAKRIYISALKTAKKDGFKEGIKELLRYSDLDEKEYLKVINIFDSTS